MIKKKRIYIVAKTYPTISEKYAELVCTAGVLEDGSWVRLYPMPFRLLDNNQQYQKYTWINAEIERNLSDFRPESYRPNLDTLEIEQAPQKVDWDERRRIIFNNKKVFINRSELLERKRSDNISLAVFKPTKIIDFIIEDSAREWDSKKLKSLQWLSRQSHLFKTPQEIEAEFKAVKKIPYKFSYKFEDDAGIQSTLMIEDWEIGMLYLNCLRDANADEKIAVEKVRQKYLNDFSTKDLHFFLGTTKEYHNVGSNPFIIIGVFYPPIQSQAMLF